MTAKSEVEKIIKILGLKEESLDSEYPFKECPYGSIDWLKCKAYKIQSLLSSSLTSERERIVKGIEKIEQEKCSAYGHDDRWCADCNTKLDTLDRVKDIIRGEGK